MKRATRGLRASMGWTVLGTLFLLSAAPAAHAQIGSGWTAYSPTKKTDLRGAGATYTNSGGIETLKMKPGDERAEVRVNNNYTSGQRQFQGEVRVKSGSNGTCVYQVFGGVTNATALMVVTHNVSGGDLRRYDSQTLATGVYGKWIRLNTIHNKNNDTVAVYIGGSLKGTYADRGDATHYTKYGVYNGSSSSPQSEWRSVKFWRK
jgi:alginate lyase